MFLWVSVSLHVRRGEAESIRDCVRLSAARGTVCEDSRIVPLQHTVE
jgi:hypothetical protein